MAYASFRVSLGRHLVSAGVRRTRRLWLALGRLESAWLRDRIEATPVRKPVWISGLARAGSTVLLEVAASCPGVATHQYRDFPFLYTPWWWRTFLRRSTRPGSYEPAERAHGDRLMVTPASPEAMEEVLWTAFFPHLHDPDRSNVLEADTHDPDFEAFFRDHVRKLLLAAGAERYVAKGNYNLTRLPYLLSLFPDARFVVPVRRPADHVASLLKQHRLFTRAGREHPRSVAHLDHVGHFEFGLHRTPVNAGDDEAVAAVLEDWAAGREVRGLARYWSHLYGWLADRLAADPALRAATLVVRYEDLCARPGATLRRMLEHAGFTGEGARTALDRYVDSISAPTYYAPDLTPGDLETIEDETGPVARAFGYGADAVAPGEGAYDADLPGGPDGERERREVRP